MIAEPKKRNWSDGYKEAKRMTTLKQSLALCAVAQTFPGWFTADDMTKRFREEVGLISGRTIRRYLAALEMAEVLEVSAREGSGCKFQYRWRGWPEPLHPHRHPVTVRVRPRYC